MGKDAPERERLLIKFQFPSNGKGYLNVWTTSYPRCLPRLVSVSIPFKRERVSQFEAKRNPHNNPDEVSIPFKRERVSQSKAEKPKFARRSVSIPFKRERVSQCCGLIVSAVSSSSVSIPFKRERVSQLRQEISKDTRFLMFQFPSNGKGYLNLNRCLRYGTRFRFNSLQTGKGISIYYNNQRGASPPQFQFPSNGKGYLNLRVPTLCIAYNRFQFPSNGKGYLNLQIRHTVNNPCCVSIPFKRERVSQ